MEKPTREPEQEPPMQDLNGAASNPQVIQSFIEITSSSKEEALFFLESHQWDLDAAVSTFIDNNHLPIPIARISPSPKSPSSEFSPSQSPSRSRSRSVSPPEPESMARYELRSRGRKEVVEGGSRGTRRGVRTLGDLNRVPMENSDDGEEEEVEEDNDEEDDAAQEYYAGGERSGMVVRTPNRHYDGDSIFDQARHRAVERPADLLGSSSSVRSFTGTGRILSGGTVSSVSQPPEVVNHVITLWRNGFTVNDGPLRRFDDPANAPFLESIRKSECPRELEPIDGGTQVHLDLKRREENYPVLKGSSKRKTSFPGVGRTLASSSESDALVQAASDSDVPAASPWLTQGPTAGLVVDSSLPTTSIQLRLADGTRMVSRFNLHHTIRDIRAFIEASRVGGSRDYQLQTMGFPPKQLTDQDQTIEEAGIASSVVIQKF